MPTPSPLSDALDSATFHSLSLVRSGGGANAEWQANLQLVAGDNSFRIRAGASPSLAIGALFEQVGAQRVLPPLPY